jgi:predicted nuclease of predicted toxin-antitoxin system
VKPALLVNENFPVPSLRRLREAGIAAESVQELMPGTSDSEVMAHARQHGLWVVTFDRDYGELVFARGEPAPPVIVYLRQEPYPPEAPAALVLALLEEPEHIAGKFVTVTQRSVRVRDLPKQPQ